MAQRVKIVGGDGAPYDDTNPLPTAANPAPVRTAAPAYRDNVSAADLQGPATLFAEEAAIGGTLPASAHYAAVRAITPFGPSPLSTVAEVTPADADSAITLTIGQIDDATSYRLYFCGCATPHALLELTEEQRATGGTVAVAEGTNTFTPADPATPGLVTVLSYSPGIADATELDAYDGAAITLPGADPIDCSGHAWAEVTVTITPTWTGTPVCVLAAYVEDLDGAWGLRAVRDFAPADLGLVQSWPIFTNGAPGLHILALELAHCTVAISPEVV